ncbi:MAG: calcium-binding protein, partial [Selenomonadaceae bacterium]|nr:calcium-binding protein [Selenomonadaceae bacterium]
MTPQEVIKKFMARLANHGFSTAADDLGNDMFDAAVRASSRFSSAQEVIDAMKADQESAERAAVEEILGSEYAGKLMSDLDADTLSGKENSIKLRKAKIFLEKYCGIQLGKNFLFTSDGTLVSFSFGTASNVDTGAITGSDANITLTAGDTDFYGTELDLSALAESYGLTLEEDGSLIIGTGEEKTDRSIVDEISVNTYTASTSAAQKIYTGTRNWVVQATDADDTITAGGADSINAGAGDDSITVNGSGTTVTGGDGSDTIKISADVNDVTLTDFSSEDVMTISGTFEIGAAKIEDMMLVITDATGTRKLKLGDFTNLDGTVNVNGTKTSIGQWLSDSGINLADLSEENNQTYFDQWLGARMASDDEYQPTPIETPPAEIELDEKPTENFSLNVTGSSPTVNLENFTALADGDKVSVDGSEVGSVSSTFPNAATFTRNGLTIHLLGERNSDGTIESKTLDDLTDAQKAIVAGLFKWWAADCLTLDEKSLGISFNDPTAMIKDIGLYFYTDTSSEALAAVSNAQRSSADGVPVRLTLSVNMKYYDNISATDLDGDGVYNGSHAGLIDRTITHEFVHALMGANVNFTNLLPQFITEGISELAHGIDDERASTIFRLAFDADELSSGLDLSPGTGTLNAYAGGFMFLRYFAKQAALQTLLLPAYGDITADIDLSKFEIGDSLYCDDEGNVSTDASGIFLGKIVDDIEVGGTGGDAIYLVNDCGVKQIVHTAANDFQVGQITADVRYVGSTADDYAEVVEGACSIDGGDGNDYFVVTGQYSSITAGDGSDTVRLGEGGHHSINLGDGDNFVRMEGKPLLGGDGSYTIARNYSNTITGGAGNDTLNNGNGVAAVDSIGNAYTAYEVFQGDDGNFYVSGYLDADGVYIEENISVKPVQFFQFNYNHSFDLGDGDNQINLSYLTDTSILTGGGVDQIIVTHSDGGKIFSGAGNDLVSLGGGDGNSIVTGAGLDIVVLSNYSASNNSISTGDGSDYVLFGRLNDSLTAAGYIAHDENLIDLGAGNDSLDFAGANNTITAGAGDDLLKEISGSAGGNHFIFSGSFGNDTLVGLMANDSIHLAEDCSTVLSGNILTVKRGENVAGTIELQDAADLTQLNIVSGAEILDGFVADGADWNYYVDGEWKFTVSGLSKQPTDEMLSGGVLTVSKNYFAGKVVTIAGDGYSLALGKNMAAPKNSAANYSDGTFTTAGTTEGYTLSDDGKSITYSAATTKSFEFEGLDDDTTAKNFWFSGSTIKIGKEAVPTDGTPVKLLTEGYTLKLGKNMAAPKNSKATYSDGIYKSAGKTAGYNL